MAKLCFHVEDYDATFGMRSREHDTPPQLFNGSDSQGFRIIMNNLRCNSILKTSDISLVCSESALSLYSEHQFNDFYIFKTI